MIVLQIILKIVFGIPAFIVAMVAMILGFVVLGVSLVAAFLSGLASLADE